MSAFHLFRLRYFLWLSQLGWPRLTTALLGCIAVVTWLWLIPHLQASLEDQRDELGRIHESLRDVQVDIPTVLRPASESKAESFYAILGEKTQTEHQIKVLFSLAKKAGLSLNQADYKSVADKNGAFQSYQIQLPVVGSYGAVRQFCESVLLAFPFASLDEMSFKREAVGNGMLEAKLRFTLYLSEKPAPATDTLTVPQGVAA